VKLDDVKALVAALNGAGVRYLKDLEDVRSLEALNDET
jgi:hypothetical protein